MSSFNWIDSDSNKRKQGVWVEKDGNKFRIGSPSTLQATQCLEKYVKMKQGKKKDYQLKPSEQYECTVLTVSDLKLLDWKVTDSNGEDVPYTKANAKNALINDSDFLSWINEQSADHELFDRDKREEDVKK